MAHPNTMRSHRAAIGSEIRPLTGLRALAATWVVFYHFHFTPGIGFGGHWGSPLRPVLRAGATGVDLFYVLSGFVITLTYVQTLGRRFSPGESLRFLWARVCRIWPVYALVTTLYGGWLLYKATRVTDGNVAYQTIQPIVDLPHYLLQLSMVQLWSHPQSGGSSWLGQTWSISAEWLAYVAFPLVALLLLRVRRAPAAVHAALAVLVLLPMAWVTFRTGGPTVDWSWLYRIAGGFLSGAFTCLAVERIAVTPRIRRLASTLAVVALVLILAGLWWGDRRGIANPDSAFGGVVTVCFPLLVGSLALSTSGLGRLLATAPLVHGGRISFSLYLVHIPVFEVFWTCMQWRPALHPWGLPWAVLLPLVFCLPFLLAHLLYRWVEEPARRTMRAWLPARRRPLAVAPSAPAPRIALHRPAAPRIVPPRVAEGSRPDGSLAGGSVADSPG